MIPIRKAVCVLVCIIVIVVAVIVVFNGAKENPSQSLLSNPENMATANGTETIKNTDTSNINTPNPNEDVKVIEQDKIASTPIVIYLNTVNPNAKLTRAPEDKEEVIPAYDEDVVPTEAPIQVPTEAPTQAPTEAPTQAPTEAPTQIPTEAPTQVPTEAPTQVPTEAPTQVPTEAPTQVPTEVPTPVPTEAPTQVPTEAPTQVPTEAPTPVPTEVPTLAPDVGAENFKNIQREISKASCGFIHEVLPKFDGERGYDLYRYIDLSSVDRNQLYECLKNFFITTVAHSFEFDFSSGNLASVLSSAYCNNCGKLKLGYIDSNTEKMIKVFNDVNPSEAINVMLDFLYENTVVNENNPNERLFVCCDCN